MDKGPKDYGNSAGMDSISSYVVFTERSREGTVYKCPEGQVFLRAEHARPIHNLVLKSVRHLGHTVPELSFFDRAELFYRDGRLAGARVCGKYVVGVNEEGGLEVRGWGTTEEPKFTFEGKRGITPSPSDEGDSYVAVYNREAGTMVRWDLKSQYGREPLTGDEANTHTSFALGSAEERGHPDLIDPAKVSTSEIRERIRGVELESLYRVLMPDPLTNASDVLALKLSDKHRMLLYLIDRSRLEYDLAMVYAMAQHCDQEELEEFAETHGVTVEKAKLLWARKHFTERTMFVRHNVQKIHEQNGKALRDVFEKTLGYAVYQSAFADWETMTLVKLQDPSEIKRPLLRREIESAKKRLGFPGRGRQRQTDKERKQLRAARLRAIREAAMELCAEAKIAKMNEVAAEDLLTPAAVAEKMGKHVSTLYRWLNSSKLDFEAVINDCLRRSGFRT